MNVTVPPGVVSGQQIGVDVGGGQMMSVIVPPGHIPGSVFGFQVPSVAEPSSKTALLALPGAPRPLGPPAPMNMQQPPAQQVAQFAPWLPVDATLPTVGFIAANARSTTRGANANPFRQEYIFGNGTKGVGYYNVQTQDAYGIIYKRIKAKRESSSTNYVCNMVCAMTVCLPVCPCLWFGCLKDKQLKVEELREMEEVARARSQAPGPTGVVGLPADQRMAEGRRDQYYGQDDSWIFPVVISPPSPFQPTTHHPPPTH